MDTNLRNALIALVILVIAVGGFFIYQTYFRAEVAATNDGQVAGEADDGASLPDGASVTEDVKLNETKRLAGASITPVEIVEDSRCPTDVQCIQAGTVRVRASVTARGDAQAQDVMFELGVPMTVGMDQITLVKVEPAKHSGTQTAPGDYVFTFTVVKGGGSEYFKG